MLMMVEWMNATKISRIEYFIIPPKYNIDLGYYKYPLKSFIQRRQTARTI